MRMRLMPLVTVAAVVFLGAACGGDGDGSLDTDYPSAGEDRFERTVATVEIEITLPSVSTRPVALGGLETVELEGPMLVMRGDPDDADKDGLAEVETEIVELTLTGTSSVGPIEVRQSPDRRSMGEVEQQEQGQDFPANSFFDIFLEVEVLEIGLVGYNDEPIGMESELSDLPPGFLDQYEGALALPTPLLSVESDEEFARILDALHTPNPPEDGEPVDGDEPDAGATESPEPEAEITDAQLAAISQAIIDQVSLPGYELDETRTGPVSNSDWIAESLNVKEAPKVVDQYGRTGGYRMEWFSPTSGIYQIRISLSAFDSTAGPRGYLENRVSFLQGGIGMSSLHEGTLHAVEPFTPTVNSGAVGITLGFGDAAGGQYYETYVGAPEGQLRGSVSLFTSSEPGDAERTQAEDLLESMRAAMLDVLEG